MIVSPIIAPEIEVATEPDPVGDDRHVPRPGSRRGQAVARGRTAAPIEHDAPLGAPGALGAPSIATAPRPAASTPRDRHSAAVNAARITAP